MKTTAKIGAVLFCAALFVSTLYLTHDMAVFTYLLESTDTFSTSTPSDMAKRHDFLSRNLPAASIYSQLQEYVKEE